MCVYTVCVAFNTYSAPPSNSSRYLTRCGSSSSRSRRSATVTSAQTSGRVNSSWCCSSAPPLWSFRLRSVTSLLTHYIKRIIHKQIHREINNKGQQGNPPLELGNQGTVVEHLSLHQTHRQTRRSTAWRRSKQYPPRIVAHREADEYPKGIRSECHYLRQGRGYAIMSVCLSFS